MEVKIKQGAELVEATIEMVDGVMVVSPKEVKFEPKDGDVVTITTEIGGNYTCFFKGCVNGDIYSYGGLNNLYNMLFEIGLVCCSKEQRTIYPATEEEKKRLFNKLAEEGYEFDFKKMELVEMKLEPKEGEEFWLPIYYAYPHGFNPVKSLLNKGRDKEYLHKGWYFKTKEECQEFCDRLNDAINSIKP